MKTLDFRPHKSKKSFQSNYHLHDLAEKHGKNLLIQWGVGYEEFGEDLRNKRVWEMGKDKPDIKISYRNFSALLDWKGKHNSVWKINRRAYNSYLLWGKQLNIPVIIAFAVFSKEDSFNDFRFAVLNYHKIKTSDKKEWDKNETLSFKKELPLFTKSNLIKALEIITD